MSIFKKKDSTRSNKSSRLILPVDSAEEFVLVVKPATIGDIAELYDVSRPTMRKMLKPIWKKLGVIAGRTFNCRQVETIFRFLGIPNRPFNWATQTA